MFLWLNFTDMHFHTASFSSEFLYCKYSVKKNTDSSFQDEEIRNFKFIFFFFFKFNLKNSNSKIQILQKVATHTGHRSSTGNSR